MKSAKKLPLTIAQADLVAVVDRYRFFYNRSPSQKELAKELGCAVSTARNRVEICRTKGALTKGPWRDLEVTK